MNSAAALAAVAFLVVPGGAAADSGEEIYQKRCSLCHAGGAGGAPKFKDRGDWEPRAARGRLSLYEIALKGKPNTAMMAKGGFRDLSNDEVMAAVDYMVAQAGLNPGLQPESFDDRTATDRIAEALRAQLAPGAKIEMQEGVASVTGLGIRIGTRAGVVWLRGMVKSAELIERADAIAKAAGGGRKVENRLISASVFEWD